MYNLWSGSFSVHLDRFRFGLYGNAKERVKVMLELEASDFQPCLLLKDVVYKDPLPRLKLEQLFFPYPCDTNGSCCLATSTAAGDELS